MKPCYSNITLPAAYLKELREEAKKQETNVKNLILKVQEEDKKRETNFKSLISEIRWPVNDTYRLADIAKTHSYGKLSFRKFGTSHILTDITGKVGEVIFLRLKFKEITFSRYYSSKMHIYKNETS